MSGRNDVKEVVDVLANIAIEADPTLDPNYVAPVEGAVDGDGNPLQTHIEDNLEGDADALAAAAALEDDGGDAGDEDDDDGTGDEDTGDGGDGIRTIAQLAEAIEVEPAFLYDMEIGMGEGKDPVKLGELKDQYQSVTTERDGLQAKVTELEANAGDSQSLANLGQGVSQEMLKAFSYMDNLQTQFNAVDWNAEEAADAGQAALLRQKYQEAFGQGQQAVTQAQTNMEGLKQENLKRAATKMFEMIPEWKDDGVRKTDQGKMRDVMVSAGYDDKAVNSITDPRVMLLLRELSGLREYKAAQEGAGAAALKKVRKAPKVLKGLGVRGKKNTKKEIATLTQTAHNARPSQRKGAELNAVKAILANSVG